MVFSKNFYDGSEEGSTDFKFVEYGVLLEYFVPLVHITQEFRPANLNLKGGLRAKTLCKYTTEEK